MPSVRRRLSRNITNGVVTNPLRLNCGHGTHVGKVRTNNEDNFLSLAEHGLWIVADGMGGHNDGEVASAIAVETIAESVRSGMSLSESLFRAHTAIVNAITEGRGQTGMGTTAVVLQVDEVTSTISWVGDSRAYLWTPEGLSLISTDHTVYEMLRQRGEITAAPDHSNPDWGVLTQALGVEARRSPKPDSITIPFPPSGKILLCSDGLTNEISDNTLREILDTAVEMGLSDQRIVDKLIEYALKRGGHDNITAILVSLPKGAPRSLTTRRLDSVGGLPNPRKRGFFSRPVLFGMTIGLWAVLAIALMVDWMMPSEGQPSRWSQFWDQVGSWGNGTEEKPVRPGEIVDLPSNRPVGSEPASITPLMPLIHQGANIMEAGGANADRESSVTEPTGSAGSMNHPGKKPEVSTSPQVLPAARQADDAERKGVSNHFAVSELPEATGVGDQEKLPTVDSAP